MKLVFYGMGIPFALIAGVLSDRCFNHRNTLYTASVMIAQAACFAVYFLPKGPESYNRLLILQGITGGGLGYSMTTGTAMMADNVEDSGLPAAAAGGGVVYSLGVAAAQWYSGHRGPTRGWRYPF